MNLLRICRFASVLVALVLAGCAVVNVTPVATGDVLVRERVAVTVDQPWNQFERSVSENNIPTWTVEGMWVDMLRFFVGVKDGAAIVPASGGSAPAPAKFRSTMQPAEVVSMFEGLLTRDGSSFTLDRLEPAEFIGQPGFRFEYSRIRKADEVRLRGVAWGAIRNGELFLIDYSAPRLGFFDRLLPRVEALVRSARVRS